MRHVGRSFGGVRAVNDVSFTLEEGRSLGFIGPNGAGKTTLFDIISGFVAPNRGGQRVGVGGNSPEGMRKAADEFCRNAGWRQSVHSRLQSDGGTYYLVDVLCSNSD